MSQLSDRVVIGMDPHKRSVTVAVMACDETVLDRGRFATDRDGTAAVLAAECAVLRTAIGRPPPWLRGVL